MYLLCTYKTHVTAEYIHTSSHIPILLPNPRSHHSGPGSICLQGWCSQRGYLSLCRHPLPYPPRPTSPPTPGPALTVHTQQRRPSSQSDPSRPAAGIFAENSMVTTWILREETCWLIPILTTNVRIVQLIFELLLANHSICTKLFPAHSLLGSDRETAPRLT